MTQNERQDGTDEAGIPAEAAPEKTLSPAARRALEEAEARRAVAGAETLPPETGGRRNGLEPTRYGDWEKKGILSDF